MMEFSDLIDLAKQTAADVKDKVSDPSGKVSDAVSDIVSKLNEALPYLAKAGYTMDCLEIEVGVPPKLIPHFSVAEVLAETIELSLAELEGNTMGYALLKALLRATDLQQKVEIEGMSFDRIEIEVGLLPAVRLSYKTTNPLEQL
ncbi:MAG: hypothetical protein ACJ0Q6_02570 [Candidatus Azotimanducaceae bacterium]